MGDNVVNKSTNTPWYKGQTIMQYLENVEISNKNLDKPFRIPVQWVNRPSSDFRGFSGLIASGSIRVGDKVKIIPGGQSSTIETIITGDREVIKASAGESITITLDDQIDVSRGDILVDKKNPCSEADQFQTRILWMHDDPMMPGRQYLFKSNTQSALLTLGKLKHRIDVNTLDNLPAKILEMNEIGICNISLDRQIAFDSYDNNQTMGGFISVSYTHLRAHET